MQCLTVELRAVAHDGAGLGQVLDDGQVVALAVA